MEFYEVLKELLFQQYFFHWFLPYVCWAIPTCYRIYFGDGLFFWQEIEIGDSIEVHYVGTPEGGEQFDSSRDRGETLPFTVGAGQMIAGFDAGVVGMKIGESKVMTLSPEEAYGPSSIIETIPMAELQSFIDAGI